MNRLNSYRLSGVALLTPLVFLLAALTSSGVWATGNPATAQRSETSQALVSAEWLRSNLTDPRLVLIDASPTPLFAAKHIAGARHYDFYMDGGRELPREVMQKRMQGWGVNADSLIVIYDEGAAIGAANVYYLLAYYGFPMQQMRILDGGLHRWIGTGGATAKVDATTTATKPPLGTFQIGGLHESIRVRMNPFLLASGDTKGAVLIDALEPDYYFGGAAFFGRGGHIPNAINLPSEDFFNADKTFKSTAELARMAEHYRIRRDQQILSHCGGGVAATVPWFALHVLLGYPDVKVYRESQREWLRDERQLPFWTYATPRMLRDAQWLNGWNHWMLRGAGASNLSVIDIRDATAYAKGHIGFAINIPSDVFANALAQPKTIAASLPSVLGTAGVNGQDEIVITSEGGLNTASALAMLALHAIGHEHVSVLTASHDDWQLAGYTLTKEPTTVGTPKSPRDFVVRPTTYTVAATAATNGAVLISSDSVAGADMPRIYVHSGQSVGAKPTDGKSVHVPYAQLVDRNGKPKPAHEIWTILDKAGVSRYAEVVTMADQLGEAAMNYAVLKLMGFANVKVRLP